MTLTDQNRSHYRARHTLEQTIRQRLRSAARSYSHKCFDSDDQAARRVSAWRYRGVAAPSAQLVHPIVRVTRLVNGPRLLFKLRLRSDISSDAGAFPRPLHGQAPTGHLQR